jgi:hypothetical protein
MDANEILEKVLEETKESRAGLAKSIGLQPHRLQDIARGKSKEFPYEVADKIASTYPQFSRKWLLTGEGDMLTTRDTTVTGSGNAVNTVTGNGNKVSANVAGDFADLASKFSEALKTSQEQLSSSQCQIDRLIKVIEKLSGVEK